MNMNLPQYVNHNILSADGTGVLIMDNKYEIKKFRDGQYQHIGFSATSKNAKKMARIVSKKGNNVRVYCNRTGVMLYWFCNGKKYKGIR